MMDNLRHVHLVGMGGAGMSGLAEMLLQKGLRVSGSDQESSATLTRLQGLGAQTFVGHAAAHLGDADLVVTSTAVGPDNPEVVAAHLKGVPQIARADMLARLMRGRLGIAVAGTHGKTTTTGLVTSVLMAADQEPGFAIGGNLLSAGVNARLGQGAAIVVEADESDASFLKLSPQIAVITNVDADHMATYGHSLAGLHDAFVSFVHRLPANGCAVVCLDDPAVCKLLARLGRPVLTYGTRPDAQVRASDIRAVGDQMHFTAHWAPRAKAQAAAHTGADESAGATAPLSASLSASLSVSLPVSFLGSSAGSSLGSCPDSFPIALALTGHHNVLNALAAIAVAQLMGVSAANVQQALAGFAGVGRRFERYGELPASGGGHYTLVDDYGHHPVEVRATLAAARAAFPGRRLLLAFEPHRYSRTRDCFADFSKVLGLADALLLVDVYPAGEAPLPGADSPALARATREHTASPVALVGAVTRLAVAIEDSAQAGDVVLCMGAGSIGSVAAQLRQRSGLAAREMPSADAAHSANKALQNKEQEAMEGSGL